MKYEKVAVRQIADEVSTLTGLNKYNRSKMPGTTDFLQAGIDPAGRYVTGLDENAYDVSLLKDTELRDRLKKERRELREHLESLTKKDLSATSSFWETFGVQINSDQELILDSKNPMDVIKYHVLTANGYAAPTQQLAGNPEFLQAKYYCFVEERAEAEDISTQKKRDQARSELYKLSDNYDHSLLIGQYLIGERFKKGMKPNTIYKMLSNFIDKDYESLVRFIKAMSLSAEDLQFKVTIDRAVKKKMITFSDGYYQRGNITLGKSLNDVYSFLKRPENAGEFLSIKEELEQ